MSKAHDIQAGRVTTDQLIENFADLHPPLNPMQAAVESSRCLFCHDAPCTEACPTGIDIPGFIRKISTGNVRGAAKTILDENIMGGTCANVCPVEELCEKLCVRNTAEDKPVEIGRLQRFATDHLFETGIQPYTRGSDTGHRIAVVGAGPAGLACAHRLALLGHRVSVFESRDKAGGLNEYGIAYYKMNDDRAAREVDFILGIGGIELKTGVNVGKDVTLASLRQDFDAVFIGIGLGDVNELGLENEDLPGLLNAVDYIERIRQDDLGSLEIGRRVVVIGGGSTAIDMAVQSRKLGAEQVTMVYRRGPEQMSATWHEREIARNAGVVIRTWARPVQLLQDSQGLTGIEFERTRLDSDGKLTGTGEKEILHADMAFKAVGQRLHQSVFENEPESPEMAGSKFAVDDLKQTNLGLVLAGGDCTPGLDLTVDAVQDGKLAAETIHQKLTGQDNG
jgi:glutamate synthase (NADPH/NADH) small chain